MWTNSKRRKLAILINVIPPYRVPVFSGLARCFDTSILVSKGEDNRRWDGVSVPDASRKVVWGVTLRRTIRSARGGVAEQKYLQLHPGYFTSLVALRPDIIVSTEMGLRSLIALVFGRLFKVPVVVWWGGTPHTERLRSSAKIWFRKRLFVRAVSHWISYGQSSTDYLTSIGVPNERIFQTQNCVDDRLFRGDAQPASLNAGVPRALIVGRLVDRKGYDEFLEAASRVMRAGSEFTVVIVGEGPNRSQILAKATQLGVPVVHFPYVPTPEMPSIYRACDFLVFPTFDDVWGLVVNEALLCGLPVIASKYAGSSAELLPSSNIFDPGNSEDFDRVLEDAVNRRIAASDTTPVKGTTQLTDEMVRYLDGIAATDRN